MIHDLTVAAQKINVIIINFNNFLKPIDLIGSVKISEAHCRSTDAKEFGS